MYRSHVAALWLVAALFVALHARTIPVTLEDEDSVNMALGVEAFDVRRYAPHPPGYPVYIAMAKSSTAIVSALQPEWPRGRRAAAGLAWLSVLCGALGVFVLAAWWRGLGLTPWWSVGAATMTVVSPLYWFTAARPLTDVPGLVIALAVQAAVMHTLKRESPSEGLRWVLISAAAGLAIGVRSQTMWLTLPALVWALLRLARTRPAIAPLVPLGGLAGVLMWAMPMVWLTGGLTEYLNVLRGQGQHDFDGVRMLWTNPSWSLLREDLRQTFLHPWDVTRGAWLVLTAAAVGSVILARQSRRHAAWLAVLTVPYLTFHLLFHEVETIRYALPTVSVVAGLAAFSFSLLRPAGGAGLIAACVAGVAVIHPITRQYADGAPVFLALDAIQQEAAATNTLPRIEAHQRAWWATSRAIDWVRREWPVDVPRLVRSGETQRLVEYWRSGATTPIVFLSDPALDDLRRFSRESAIERGHYVLAPPAATLIAGLRTYEVGWWTLAPPDWMLSHGWHTTRTLRAEPTTPGLATAYLRSRPDPTIIVVSATHTGATAAPVHVVARLDGQEVDRWTVDPDDSVTRWLELPAGTLAGVAPYAELTLQADTGESGEPGVEFDQFDATSDGPLVALGRGWQSLESAPATSDSWRRTTQLSELRVRHPGAPVQVTIRGAAPRDEFPFAPTVLIAAGQVVLARFAPEDDFEESFDVPADVLDEVDGVISIAVDLRASAEERARGVIERPGLRVRDVSVTRRAPR